MKKIKFSAVLFFSLLCFCMLSCCKKSDDKIESDNSQTEENALLNAAENSGENTENVDDELLLLESEEMRLASEIDQLDDAENYSVLNEELYLIDSDSSLKIMEFGNEILIPDFSEQKKIVVHSSGSTVVRNFYDELYRLSKKETWNFSTIENAHLEKSESFEYKQDSYKPFKKVIVLDKSENQILYNEEKLPVASKKYYSDENKKVITEEISWTYDNLNRVLEEISVSYIYKTEKYDKLKDKLKKTKSYNYKNENTEPDYYYYENDVLKYRTVYSQEPGSFVTTAFFDNDYSIKVFYKENQKRKEIFYHNNDVLREKEYE